MNYFKKYSIYVLIVLLSFFALMPLFQTGFFPIHDDEQIGRLYELDQSLKAGHFPVRISQNLGFGYGYPLFNFYPSFIYYVAEIFVLLGLGYILSIKLMIGLGFILAGLFMYLFSKEYFGKMGGIISAIAYTYVPYHALDVYVRGALPEFWSFVFLPAIFLSYKKLCDKGENKYVIITSLLLACLILTHNLIAMMSSIFVGIYLLFLLYGTKNKKRFFIQAAISGFLSLCLSASFWIPSFFERQYTMIELLTKELADYKQHFVYLRQLWDSPWGYGGSLYGLYDGLSFQIGKVHILGSALALFVGFYLFIKKYKSWNIIFLFFCFFIFAGFMTTFYAEFIWNNLQFFSYIQFPWRFLLFTAFTASFLLGAIILISKSIKIRLAITMIMLALIIFFYKDFFKPADYFTNAKDEDYISNDVIKWRTSIMAFEYVPKGVATKISTNNTTIIDIEKDEVATRSFEVRKGDLQVKELQIKPHYKKFQIAGQGGGVLRINTYSFPGWKVFIDGNEASFNDNNKLKLIETQVPNGNHVVEAKFTDTIYRTIGNVLSICSIIGILLYIIVLSRKNEKKSSYGKKKAN
jgi:uncharacterized membrane protein